MSSVISASFETSGVHNLLGGPGPTSIQVLPVTINSSRALNPDETASCAVNISGMGLTAPPLAVWVADITGSSGGWAEVIATVAGVTADSLTIYIHNARPSAWTVNATYKLCFLLG